MKCPQCHFSNAQGTTECDNCGVVFKHLKRGGRQEQIQQGPDLCSWNEVGIACQHRGVVKIENSWYCREHLDRRDKLEPKGRGNYPVNPTSRSPHMRQWDAWYAEWLAARRPQPLPVPAFLREREPGSDDEPVAEETA